MQAAALYRTSIGKKAIMAVSGVIWIGYVVMHMYGNLKAFLGEAAFNHYAEGLREMGAPIFGHLHLLTVARILFVVSIVLHVWAALSLTQQARQARPQNYATRRVVQANYASVTMRYGGVVILLFLLLHLMQLTWGVSAVHGDFIPGQPYHNLVTNFQSLPVTLVYLVAVVALGLHLFHGTWSMFQTLGFNNERMDRLIRGLAWALAILVPVGFASVPIAVQLGILS